MALDALEALFVEADHGQELPQVLECRIPDPFAGVVRDEGTVDARQGLAHLARREGGRFRKLRFRRCKLRTNKGRPKRTMRCSTEWLHGVHDESCDHGTTSQRVVLVVEEGLRTLKRH